ncbi:MAG: DUF5615 family PIN-like protein [Elusimicrobia bacterium]|nr:DUF5615 family PIN-like protein [Elusimicrobiota bacterium]
MRFFIDMPLSTETTAFLRQLGHDAIHARELRMQKAPDEKIVEKARLEKRIILTMDLGFGALLAHAGTQFPSVILFRQEDERPETIHRLLSLNLPRLDQDLQAGALVTIADKKVRVHRLPIDG